MRSLINGIKRSRKKQVLLVAGFALLMMLNFTLLSGVTKSSQITTEKADALYGGKSDMTSHTYSGYIIDYSSFFSRQVCGITMISENVGVSAAHCFEEDGYYYAGFGDLSPEPERNIPIIKYKLDDSWNSDTLRGDLAVIGIEREGDQFDKYAVIAAPTVGCSYEVLAYGATDQDVLSSADLRRKADVCVDRITSDRIYISSDEGGICFGDSGSPIFIKGTNKMVGIISAITADNDKYSEDNCFINNTAVATRLDNNLNFVSSNQDTVLDVSECPTASGRSCDENTECRSNECREPGGYNYTSTLDYRSLDFIFGGYFGLALIVIFISITLLFIYVIYRSFTTYN